MQAKYYAKLWRQTGLCVVEVILTPQARNDLDEIDRFGIENFGEAVAIDYMQGFFAAFARLSEYPESAPLLPRITPPTRSLSYRSHRIIHDYQSGRVLVIRILHHSRDIGRALR
jgi:toxin ParE1/3/4